MIDLIIADDRTLCREGLLRILAEHHDLRVVAEAKSAEELIVKAADVPAHVVLLDVSLPGPNLAELVRRIRRRRGSPRILLLNASSGHAGVRAAVRSGAVGAIARQEPLAALIDAIRRIAGGGRSVSRALTRKAGPPVEGLSEREFEVLRLVGAGRNRREIGEELGLSPKTVSTYRDRLLKKLGLRNLSELVRFAIDRGVAY
jgi:DNA-binding NarL/FixJ family response regulator